jgi:DNA-binding response OmpR family regulator
MDTKPATVLIVEDEQDLREALKTALSYENFNVLTAGDGEEGLRTALSEKPNLILLDVVMPKMDGLAMLKQVRADEWGKSVKVIVMTVLDDLENVAEAIESGSDEYIVKTNVTLGAIVAKVKEKLTI